VTFLGYCTTGTGELELWQVAIDATTRLHVYPDGRAWSWSWSGSCWCRLEVTGSDVVAEARRMIDALPPAWTRPGLVTVNLPVVSRESAGAWG
jgi:hypothetical protein